MQDEVAAAEARQVAAARDGDPRAQEELLAGLRPRLLRYCLARLGERERAEDVTQEVCLAVLSALPRYREQGVPFAAFAFRVAQHKVADVYREQGRRRVELVAEPPDAVSDEPGPAELVEAADDRRRAEALLATLPEQQREVLRLRVAAGRSAQEVADVLGTTAGAVRVTQHRALARLRQAAGGER